MVDKVVKALDGLKHVTLSSVMGNSTLRKEKMTMCVQLADQISTVRPGVQSLSDLTARAVESLIRLCDDPDADVRTVADESLNRIIRVSSDIQIYRIQVDLFKEIRKNGPARCVRSALTKFAALSDRMRQTRGRVFASQLAPCIVVLAHRTDESVLETLATAMGKIFPVLGVFTHDNEVKNVIKAFLSNLSSDSAVIRRSSASIIAIIVEHCRKPHVFFPFVLNSLLDVVVPISPEITSNYILGVFSCLRAILPLLPGSDGDSKRLKQNLSCSEELSVYTDKLLQIYELCLHYLSSHDHNVITASLELLNLLITKPNKELRVALTHPGGIPRSYIHAPRHPSRIWSRSVSEMSVAMSLPPGEDSIFEEGDEPFQTFTHQELQASRDLSLPSDNRQRTKSLADDSEEDVDSEAESEAPATSSVFSNLNETGSLSLEEVDERRGEPSHEDLFSLSLAEAIEEKELDVGCFTDAAMPLLFCSRRLASFLLEGTPGALRSGRKVRVSVKSLVLSCLSNMVQISPCIFSVKLTPFSDCDQSISDALLFSTHNDPQLRGAACNLAGSYVNAMLIAYKGRRVSPLDDESSTLHISKLLSILDKGIQDSSPATARLALTGIKECLPHLITSEYSKEAIPLLLFLPAIAKGTYWLNQIWLVELLSDLDFAVVHEVIGGNELQEIVLKNVLFELLGSEDSRVRTAAADGIANVISRFFCADCGYVAYSRKNAYSLKQILLPVKGSSLSKDLNLFPPYSLLVEPTDVDNVMEGNLSRIVASLTQRLLCADERFQMFGILEALSALAETYPPILYPDGWFRAKAQTSSSLLLQLISIATSSPFLVDLTAQNIALTVTGRLYAGIALCSLKKTQNPSETLWTVFDSEQLGALSEAILAHVLKLLNVYVQLQECPLVMKGGAILHLLPTKKAGPDKEDASAPYKQNPHYLRLHQTLKSAHANYKTSLETSASSKLLSLLETLLNTLSTLLEMSTAKGSDRVAEEILSYLRSVFSLQPRASIVCVIQLIKSLSSVNLPYFWPGMEREADLDSNSLFYYSSQLSLENMTERTRNRISSGTTSKTPAANIGLSPGKQKKPQTGSDAAAGLAAYVRLLEPMVIKALQMYTISSNVELQALVLSMLSQLIQLKVNFCLLDAQQTFITFVKKQFDLIERGQIRGVEFLLPYIFRFFVLLSNEKQHSKSLISIPDILQLFLGLMASEQPKLTHCVPGLKPVVNDVFLHRVLGTEDKKECETQREVLLNMLLRLAQYDEVLSALCFFVRSDDVVATQVMQVVLPLLSRRQLVLENASGYRAFSSLMASIPTNVLRQSQPFLGVIFSDPPSKTNPGDFARWISGLAVLIESCLDLKEDAVLSRINGLVHPVDLRAFLAPPATVADPLLISVPSPSIPPAESLARLLLLAASRSAVVILDDLWGSSALQNALLVYLNTLLHLLMSGTFHEVVKSFECLLTEETGIVREISNIFLDLRLVRPALTCQYLNLLALLNYTDQSLWSIVLKDSEAFCATLIQRCAVLALADYLCECSRDLETIEFFFDKSMNQIMLLSSESPIREFLSLASQRPEHCSLLMKYLKSYEPRTPSLIEKTLRLLEVIHMDQGGAVVSLLVAKFVGLPFVALSRLASGIACRRLEYFLTLPHSDILSRLPYDDFRVIFCSMVENTWSQRHGALATLVHKLNQEVYKEADPRGDPLQSVSQSFDLQMGEEWYFLQIKQRCCNETYRGCEMGSLLSKLGLEYIRQIMMDVSFRNSLLTDCFLAVKKINQEARGSTLNDIPLFIASRECLLNRVKSSLGKLENETFSEHHLSLISTITSYLDVVPPSSSFLGQDIDSIARLYFFNVKHMEHISLEPHIVENFLLFTCSILMHTEAQTWLCLPENKKVLNKMLQTFQRIIIYFLSDQRSDQAFNEEEALHFMIAFVVKPDRPLPQYLLGLLRKSVILLCRTPSLSNKALSIPDAIELQDLDYLRLFIDRFCVLGWTTRHQFEEIWAALLGGLGLNAESPEASSFVLQASISSLEGIGMLLETTLLEPFCGNLVISEFRRHGRDLTCLREFAVGLPRLVTTDKFYCNLETVESQHRYLPGFLSIEYIWSAIQQSAVEIPELTAQRQALADSGVDLNSCLHFLLDVFCQWKNEPQDQHLLATALKVSLVLSDLFTEVNQFRTLLDVVLDIDSCMSPSDIPLLPFCIIVSAKCCAAVLPGLEKYERLTQMLCRSDSPPVRLAILQALLYLVEAPVVYWSHNKPSVHYGNSMFFLEDNQTVTDLVNTFVPLAVECLLQFTTDRCSWSETYELSAWALMVYLIQHYRKELVDNKEVFLKFLFTALEEAKSSASIQNSIVFGVERLLLTDCLDEAQVSEVLVTAQHFLCLPSAQSRLHGLQLLLTVSYVGKRKMGEKLSLADEPEILMAGMERVSALLDRLKLSPPGEAESVGKVLGYILQDFGAFDVLTKLIQEFLSPHHPHPHILASLLFQVLEDADLSLLQDWVVLSLPSLTHGVPAQTATRTLTCLFLSACRDPWLRALFPLVRDRRRCLQPEDRSLLSISAVHFHSQLLSQKHKDDFRAAFSSAAKTNTLCQQIIDALSIHQPP